MASISPLPEELPEKHAPGFFTWVAALVHAHRHRLLAYARKHGLDGEDALDAVQDGFASFLKLPEARAIAHDGDDSLRMLTVLVRHNLQNRLRKRTRHARAQPLIEAEPQHAVESSEELVARAEEMARVNGCILRMSALQRDVIALSLLDERDNDEIASVLGISEGYVRVLLHRAREHVRNCSYEYDDEPL